MRKFAIIHMNKEDDIEKGILGNLKPEEDVTIFCFEGTEFNHGPNVKTVVIPEEMRDREASVRNYISKYYLEDNFRGFLHVISDNVEILKDMTEFCDGIEEMMDKFNLKSWFNTETDPCNYTFRLFNPRVYVEIDREEAKKVYDKRIYWTSHANTSYVIYDFSKAVYEDVRFEDRFTIAMFYIIEFLARRRNTKARGDLNYMNFYPTIKEERGVFRLREPEWPPKQKSEDELRTESEKSQRENEIFQEMRVNNQSDGSVEQLIEDMYNRLVGNT